mmetsp:Transcript_95700/g.151418  ORF Transcript_95700/g.151418 Transcript_95700/m.151418 type:complete len:214 (+) Transcript_95700:662-1303(+)
MSLVATAATTNSINLINKQNASLLCACQLEQFTHHPGALANITLHKLRPDHTNEASICSIGHGAGCESLTCTWRAPQQHTLWWINAKRNESLRLQKWHLDDLTEALELLLCTTDIIVGHIRLLLDCHHCNRWVDFGRQWNLNTVLTAMRGVHTDTHAFFNVCGGYLLTQAYYELCKFSNFDHILGVISVWINDLRASGNLQRLLLFHHLLVAF